MNGRSDDGGIDGVGSPQRPAPDPTQGADATEGAGEAVAIAGADEAGATSAIDGVDATTAPDADLRISEDLAAGRIDTDAALAQLVDETLAAQLPADAPPELVEQLRTEIAAVLAGDPTVASLLRPD